MPSGTREALLEVRAEVRIHWGIATGLYPSRGYPPPLPPLNALTGAGFAKSVRKILMAKGLEVKILILDNLTHFRGDRSLLPLLRQ
jgi:hypothetical protein